MTDDLDLLLTDEVAAMLRVPDGTLRYWRSVDKGPTSFRQGSRVVYRRSAVLAWVAQQERVSARGDLAAS